MTYITAAKIGLPSGILEAFVFRPHSLYLTPRSSKSQKRKRKRKTLLIDPSSPKQSFPRTRHRPQIYQPYERVKVSYQDSVISV